MTTRTRDVARSAVRADLAQVALELFLRDGFDEVTITAVADSAGISRNTFMRYFSTKEDAVLAAFESRGDQVADALRSRPQHEDDWTALRRALDMVVNDHLAEPVTALATARLIRDTPSLLARRLATQCGWRPLLATALAERVGALPATSIARLVLASAALSTLDVTVELWVSADGRGDLGALLDSAFDAIAQLR